MEDRTAGTASSGRFGRTPRDFAELGGTLTQQTSELLQLSQLEVDAVNALKTGKNEWDD